MKPLPTRPDPSLTERTPQGREERGVSLDDFQRSAWAVEQAAEALDPILGPDLHVTARPMADGWLDLTISALVDLNRVHSRWSVDPVAVSRKPPVVLGIPRDPNPFPRFRLFRWLP